jgi:hypothetical protein
MLVVLELDVSEWRLKIQDCGHCERARIAGTLKRKSQSMQTRGNSPLIRLQRDQNSLEGQQSARLQTPSLRPVSRARYPD